MKIKSDSEKVLLSDMGEREIVRRLISEFKYDSYISPGDDCGAVEIGDLLLLLSTDTKTSSTHFPKGITSFDMGWAVAAANLSDIAAMGGIPIGFSVAYGLPRKTQFAMLQELQKGIFTCLSEYATPLIGADTKENNCLTITGTSIGIVNKKEVLTRKGSRPGDAVCITGPLGGASLGLRSLREELGIEMAEKRLKKPRPKIKEGRVLAKSGLVTSCMDISDGLSSSLYELLSASGNGFEIEASKIPIHQSLMHSDFSEIERQEFALHSGEEYELLFTVNLKDIGSLEEIFKVELESEFWTVGTTIDNDKIFLTDISGKKILEDRGYEHFSESK